MPDAIFVPAPSVEAVNHLRANCVTGTEVAALFGASKYMTRAELHFLKAVAQVRAIEDTERMRIGRRIERMICDEAASVYGWATKPYKQFGMLLDHRLGSSFDDFIQCPERGPGLAEAKNVDSLVWKREWVQADGSVEVPDHFKIQCHTELTVCQDADFVALCVLIGGNRLHVEFIERSEEISAGIIAETDRFYADVVAGNPPPFDFAEDADLIGKLYGYASDREVTMNDPRLIEVLADYKAQSSLKSEADKRMKELRAELLTMIGDASKVLAPGFKVTAGMVAGREVAARYQEPYRNVRVYSTKENITT